MSMAYLFAMRSSDTSTQVGCVIVDASHTVVSLGYNGWPRGVEPFEPGDPRWDRPGKYLWMEHAERNAIYNAGRTGASLSGSTFYVTLFPCADCARGIVQVGAKEVVYHTVSTELMTKATSHSWDESYQASLKMFEEAGVVVRGWSDQVLIPHGLCRGESLCFCENCCPQSKEAA
ncbi:MAG: dCMP deaminase family protein [Armatimonadetes bacterium]|nr:dCMP deaminase family protein [Armatimonadota bacterium]